MKKARKIIKNLIIGSIWTYAFVYASNLIMIKLWNFSLVSTNDWRVIDTFWENGGKIKTTRDFLFLFSIISIIPFWILGWRLIGKINYIEILLTPIKYWDEWMIKKYGSNARIIIKNIGTIEKDNHHNEEISAKLKIVEQEIDNNRATLEIREKIADKISSLKK